MEMELEEVLKAQTHIWNHIFSFINSMALKCAVELRIPDAINRHGSPITLSQLLSALQIHPQKSQHVHRLMRILAHSGFFLIHNKTTQQGDEDQEVAYSLTNSSLLLLQNNPLALSPFLLSVLDQPLLHPWHSLSTWFRSSGRDRTPFETVYGKQFLKYMESETRDGEAFNEGTASDARLVKSVLLGKYKSVFEGVESFVDVGGGIGTLAKAIAEAFPQMKCVVFDLPQVVADLEGNGHNLMFLQGDMFQVIPPADALLLKWILHNWSEEECVKILKKCKEAIGSKKKGKVIIIDMVITNNNNKKADYMSTETQLFWDLLMMASVGGKERDEKEWAQLFHKAGFGAYNIFPILGLRSLIELYP